jgi:hypothetical protein
MAFRCELIGTLICLEGTPLAATCAHYRLTVQSHLNSSWPSALPVIQFATAYDTSSAPVTSITLRVVDQSELVGIMVNLHGHGLLIHSLECLGTHE